MKALEGDLIFYFLVVHKCESFTCLRVVLAYMLICM